MVNKTNKQKRHESNARPDVLYIYVLYEYVYLHAGMSIIFVLWTSRDKKE